MQTVSMQDLEEFSYCNEERLKSFHWYNIYNPVITAELTEFEDRVVANNDAVEEIQLELLIHQHRAPAWNESLLMSTSDGLLRAIQRWITSNEYSMKMQCFISLQAVEPIALPLTRCLCLSKYPSVCVLSLDGIVIANNFIDARLVKL